ncbi:MAG TPA: asparagine synthase (glutamine-hydrolyzing) [Burkholderiaceae bacterium]|nr:asparagine synthase (glutamine-hydrolyzing) [Burkholderiaceae bacterium]
MCGIAGFWDQGGRLRAEEAGRVLRSMTDAIQHRGPDDEGSWFDPQSGIALGHRRLSIIDLSPAGHQPMSCAQDRYRIVFNGEIYNFAHLRRELEGRGYGPWRGHSDTEVLLAAIAHWGVRGALERAAGMFAFALWDSARRELVLARDRLGEKPLYYGWRGRSLLFGSELKALQAFAGWHGELDHAAAASYLRFGYVPAPHSIWRGVRKLAPAHWLLVRADGSCEGPQPYWSARAVTDRATICGSASGEEELAEELDGLLRNAVLRQMVADVPLGAFLSGGVDSSTVVALMQAQSSRPVRTFSIGFADAAYDEASRARAVAAHLGTDHTELYVTPADALAVIPQLARMYDEPFGDSSQIPTFLVAQLARRHVTVALSGDGGDELFAGYNRYAGARSTFGRIARLPLQLRRAAAAAIGATPPAVLETIAAVLNAALPARWQFAYAADKAYKLAEVMALPDVASFYRRVVALWPQPGEILPGGAPAASLVDDPAQFARFASDIEAMMALDLVTYLPDDILVKVDRAAMAVSLETRIPLLDHRVVEFAWSTPLTAKLSGGHTKRLLRSVLHRYVPPALIARPKMGFSLPIGDWLRGPLRAWAEELLAPERLVREGLFNSTAVRRAWQEHLDGRRNWQHRLWTLLMFQAWLHCWALPKSAPR